MKPNFLDAIKETPLIFDGAMGTVLYESGVFINTCYEQLCLSNPDLVLSIHQRYADAGADVMETNTYGANRFVLQSHGLSEQVREINLAAAGLARQAVGTGGYVAGSVGPVGNKIELFSETKLAELREIYREQIAALVEGGVDLIMLETFPCSDNVLLAAEIAAEFSLPIVASFIFGSNRLTPVAESVPTVFAAVDQSPVIDVVGLNCGGGAAALYTNFQEAVKYTRKPFVVMPNAGLPQTVQGRMIYMSNPEYFTEYCKNFIKLGARGIGGCCGTTPEYIRVMAKAIKGLSAVKRHIVIECRVPETAQEVAVTPLAEKSKMAAKLAAGEQVLSIEITPPRSIDLTAMLARARQCKEAGIDAINLPDGPRASARISPMIAAIEIERQVGIETVLHYCCRDRNLIGMQSDLLGGAGAGLRNYLIVTGDPPKLGDYPDATAVFDVDAVGLTQVVMNLNHGRDVGGNAISPPTSILCGIGANPNAVDMEHEIEHYFNKIRAGAEFAITQPVFDADAFLRFVERVSKFERTIPILAGVWPLVSYRNAEFMRTEVPGVVVPDAVLERMSRATTKEDAIRTGVEISQEICEKIRGAVAGYQVSAPFGNINLALRVLGR
ncbi:MAG: bifunctional homocysteine S-methyltransferase/methylenetetrahydrofolate reductase [Kiritimatiellae bacterium]|nr:bifunctional homocysteine S-methyltransferase/methylenetetrahydrofolate reductase [Kiritimatiellia bacterium]